LKNKPAKKKKKDSHFSLFNLHLEVPIKEMMHIIEATTLLTGQLIKVITSKTINYEEKKGKVLKIFLNSLAMSPNLTLLTVFRKYTSFSPIP
jgi:hypothetical protein